jgi:hypothetical protein
MRLPAEASAQARGTNAEDFFYKLKTANYELFYPPSRSFSLGSRPAVTGLGLGTSSLVFSAEKIQLRCSNSDADKAVCPL